MTPVIVRVRSVYGWEVVVEVDSLRFGNATSVARRLRNLNLQARVHQGEVRVEADP